MAVKIRLARVGRKNRPYWRIVVLDSRKKRDGAVLDFVGTYDPFRHEILSFNHERLQKWVNEGAQCSPRVLKLIKQSKSSSSASEPAAA